MPGWSTWQRSRVLPPPASRGRTGMNSTRRGRIRTGGHQQCSGRLAGSSWDNDRAKEMVLAPRSWPYALALLQLGPTPCSCAAVERRWWGVAGGLAGPLCPAPCPRLPPSPGPARRRGVPGAEEKGKPGAAPSGLQGRVLGSGGGTPLGGSLQLCHPPGLIPGGAIQIVPVQQWEFVTGERAGMEGETAQLQKGLSCLAAGMPEPAGLPAREWSLP